MKDCSFCTLVLEYGSSLSSVQKSSLRTVVRKVQILKALQYSEVNHFSFLGTVTFLYWLQNNGFGLYLVIELINLLKGDFRINKNNPNGSRIEIIVDSKITNY